MQLQATDIIAHYNRVQKAVVNTLEKEELKGLVSQVIELVVELDPPTRKQLVNVRRFLEHEKIPAESLIQSIRDISSILSNYEVRSELLAQRLGAAVDKVPKSFWSDDDSETLEQITQTDDKQELEQLMYDVNLSVTVRRAAATRRYQLADSVKEMIEVALYKAKIGTEEGE